LGGALIEWRKLWKIAVSGGVMAACVWFLRGAKLFVFWKVALGAAVYFAVLLILREEQVTAQLSFLKKEMAKK
jgi:hypothetical protein